MKIVTSDYTYPHTVFYPLYCPAAKQSTGSPDDGVAALKYAVMHVYTF